MSTATAPLPPDTPAPAPTVATAPPPSIFVEVLKGIVILGYVGLGIWICISGKNTIFAAILASASIALCQCWGFDLISRAYARWRPITE